MTIYFHSSFNGLTQPSRDSNSRWKDQKWFTGEQVAQIQEEIATKIHKTALQIPQHIIREMVETVMFVADVSMSGYIAQRNPLVHETNQIIIIDESSKNKTKYDLCNDVLNTETFASVYNEVE